MSESLDIIVNAEDKASAEFRKVQQNLEGMAKRVKEVGGQTKASVEVVGTLANAFGGTAIGAFASQLGGITEKLSAFSEVAKTGTAGAMAFKVGIAAAAGAVTYKVAEVVASWAMNIEGAKLRADDAAKSFAKMSAAMGEVRQRAFAQTREDIELVSDPAEREQAANEAAARLEKQAKELDRQIAKAAEEVAAKQKAFNNSFFKDRTLVDLQAAKDQLEGVKALQEEFAKEAQSLRDLNSERAKSIAARKEENAAKEKSDAFIAGLKAEIEMLRATKEEQLKLEAARNAPADTGKAEALLKEREALRAKAEEEKKAEAEAEAARRKEEDAQKRIADLEKKRLVDLEARRIELEKGREAAAAYRLEQEGLSSATAQRLAAQEELTRRQEEQAGKEKNLQPDTAPQAAVQGRLLTKGTGGDPFTQMVNKLTELVKVGREQVKSNEELSRELRGRGFTVKTAIIP